MTPDEDNNDSESSQTEDKPRQRWLAAQGDLRIESDPAGEIPWQEEAPAGVELLEESFRPRSDPEGTPPWPTENQDLDSAQGEPAETDE